MTREQIFLTTGAVLTTFLGFSSVLVHEIAICTGLTGTATLIYGAITWINSQKES